LGDFHNNQEALAESRQEITQIAKRSEAFGAVVVAERKKGRKRCLSVCFVVM
jgi:hypothetical protein